MSPRGSCPDIHFDMKAEFALSRATIPPKFIKEGGMVGDPGIEPGVGLPGGVTVRCRTLQHVALTLSGGIPKGAGGVKRIF